MLGPDDCNYFRDYDLGVGRYVESDPIGLSGAVNTYAYVGSGPLISRDPAGLFVAPLPPPPPVSVAGPLIGMAAGSMAGAVVGGAAIGVAIGLGVNAVIEQNTGASIGSHLYDWTHPGDPALQEEIEREANRREYQGRRQELIYTLVVE